MRKTLLILGLLTALAAPAAAGAKPPGSYVICGTACDGGGGGWTGCTQQRAEHSANFGFVRVTHYLIVSYCKVNGWLTSISIAAHGCDAGGLATCTPGAAWQSGGGVGSGYATFEARASWTVLVPPFVTNEDSLSLTVSPG